jgi:hypothetical protein
MTGIEFIDSLPTIDSFKSEAHLSLTDPIAGVYLLCADSGVVYVGQSGDIRRRLQQHRSEGRKAFVTAKWYQIDDVTARLRVEAILTLALWPSLNDGVFIGLKNPISGGRRCWEIDRKRVYRRRRK